jgi:hypothetical protein
MASLAPELVPEAWQLECLRSRKAGEDLQQLAERLASVPPGARLDGGTDGRAGAFPAHAALGACCPCWAGACVAVAMRARWREVEPVGGRAVPA